MPVPKKLTAWSFSRFKDYDTCALKFKLKHIDKIAEPPNQAMFRGSSIGKMVENYLKGKKDLLEPAAEKYRPDFKNALKLFKKDLEQGKVYAAKKTITTVIEDSWAFTRTWGLTQWNNWNECWLRVKMDYAFIVDGDTLHIVDWKTGKFRPDMNHDYIQQLELYALAGLLMFPHVKVVYPCLKYLDIGRTYPDTAHGEPLLKFTRADLPELKEVWEKRIKPMFSDTRFAPKPNRLCQWCHFRASNKVPGPTVGSVTQPGGGGQCRF